ncbi:MAG TPA: glycosyltransferase family 4 protein [Asticcacaulis sp.]|nr:glycosyltransferase family 4 protein [Asticcacaulis sp.]
MLQAPALEIARFANEASDAQLSDVLARHHRPRTPIARAAIIGNFPPRQCGLATFTRDMYACLSKALPDASWRVIAMNDAPDNDGIDAAYAYPDAVTDQIFQDDQTAYSHMAHSLNENGVEALFVQHEFGIYGGPSGAHLLDLLEAVDMPVVTTLHTILEQPTPEQRRVMQGLIRLSATLVTMAKKGADILKSVYGVPDSQIIVVPHGAPSRPLRDTAGFKARHDLAGRQVLTTFGLLSPNKGIETVIAALPELVRQCPNLTYLIIGATHPHLIRHEGEAYRERLKTMARDLGVEDHIRFINRFINDDELVDILQATDIYVTPYLTEAQITSGTLSYALALGRPVVSTPYWHAVEALSGGVGVLCPFHDTHAFTEAIGALLASEGRRAEMSLRAYEAARPSRWAAVAEAYIQRAEADVQTHIDGKAHPHPATRQALPPRPPLTAIARMSDDCGLLQHGCLRLPDRRHGYCTDDNARALSLMARLSQIEPLTPEQTRMARAYAAFVNHAWLPEGRFRNFLAYDRRWLDEGGSDDCCARAFESLADVARSNLPNDLKLWACDLGGRVLAHLDAWPSLRARAILTRALVRGTGAIGDAPTLKTRLRTFCADLHARLRHFSRDGHIWFEPELAYDNARIPEALILGGHVLNEADSMRGGLTALRWLMQAQTHAPSGAFMPAPTSRFDAQGQDHPLYDQQPLEALASVEACLSAAAVSGDEDWRAEAMRALAWFTGRNTQHLSLIDADGGCCDGLTPQGRNENQGAESLLAWPLSWLAVRLAL